MDTVEQIIDALGGTVAVARELDLAPTTVSSWKSANSIPRWRLGEIRRLAERVGVEVPQGISAKRRAAAQ